MEHIGGLLSVGATWSAVPFGAQTPGEEIRVAAMHDPPYVAIYPQPDGSYRYGGYLYELWQVIARELHLRYRVVPLLAGGYGSMDENGSWTGLVGELAYRRADIALTWIDIRQDRATVVDYIDAVPVELSQYTFFVRQGSGAIPQITPSMFSSLLRPLHSDVWCALLVSLLAVSVVLRASLRFNHERAEGRDTVRDMTWGACLLSSFMSVVGQGWASTPNSLAARTVTISSWVLGTLIYVNYTANLISYLAVVTVEKPISSLREFSEQLGWTFAVEPGIGILNDWKVSSDPYERELSRRAVSRDGFLALNLTAQSVNRTTQDKVMTYTDIRRLFYAGVSEACELVPLLSSMPPKLASYMGIAKGRDEMRQAINQVMRKMNQAGTLSRMKKQWLATNQDMCDSPANFKELSCADLLAVLVIMPLALISCVVILLGEYAWSKMRSMQHDGKTAPCRYWRLSSHNGKGTVLNAWAAKIQI
ncbi:glutamate receptor ionotropic, delta-1-like [Pollicipes pollicipes]|uniref:glutamate receptor ionotropic, delta-1-like n=1 Tax=Pollicipes pollicipes TaxID=41117 RepID=UPI00188529AD|nr:glutamate receptor ionotropic, delta-1-like [Pollicipes pollicipes]